MAIASDFPSLLTPQQEEEERSKQVKCHYASLIQYELQKLTEDQLFKVLVLVKNTVDEIDKQKSVRSKRPSRNRALFDPTKKLNVDDAGINTRFVGNQIKKILVEKNLNGGYGIISMFGQTSNIEHVAISEYICFCIPDKADLMIEVRPSENQGKNHIVLSVAEVSQVERNVTTFYSLETLTQAIDNIVKKYE